jgi:hypothetical protein
VEKGWEGCADCVRGVTRPNLVLPVGVREYVFALLLFGPCTHLGIMIAHSGTGRCWCGNFLFGEVIYLSKARQCMEYIS